MYLTRHQTVQGSRWARDGYYLPPSLGLSLLLELRRQAMVELLTALPQDEPATGTILAPLEPLHEVWAAGVTYLRSRDARKVESATAAHTLSLTLEWLAGSHSIGRFALVHDMSQDVFNEGKCTSTCQLSRMRGGYVVSSERRLNRSGARCATVTNATSGSNDTTSANDEYIEQLNVCPSHYRTHFIHTDLKTR